jgi:hypothetical protein
MQNFVAEGSCPGATTGKLSRAGSCCPDLWVRVDSTTGSTEFRGSTVVRQYPKAFPEFSLKLFWQTEIIRDPSFDSLAGPQNASDLRIIYFRLPM